MAKNQVKITFAGDSRSLEMSLNKLNSASDKTGRSLKSKLMTGAKVASAAILGGLAAAAKNQVKITFAGDSRSLEMSLNKLNSASDKTGRSLKSKLMTGAKVASTALLGGLAVAAKVGFGELQEAERVSAQTAAALKSTGGAAKVTAKQIGDLSGALMRKSGVDDEVIQSGANVLLTFTKIRNEAGKNNKIFDRATKAALDYSVALGVDMKSASLLVGKALNDPIKGISALSRAGVQFTQKQKNTIKALVDTGKSAEAQKLILKELETQFGGSAEAAGKTLSGQLNKARETFNNLAGSIVSAVLPAFQGFAGVLNGALGWMSRHETATKVIIGVLATLAAGVWAVNTATKAWAASQAALNVIMNANPAVRIATIIAALGAALVVAYKKSETFRKIVNTAFNVVKGAAQGALDVVNGIVGAIKRVLEWLGLLDKKGASSAQQFRNNMASVQQSAQVAASKTGATVPSNFIGGRDLVRRHVGGFVPGQPGTETPIMALAGEYVSPRGRTPAGGNTYTINVNALDPHAASNAVVQSVIEFERRNGKGWRS